MKKGTSPERGVESRLHERKSVFKKKKSGELRAWPKNAKRKKNQREK